MHRLISLGLVILLSGCASTANYYTSTLNSWRGSNVQSLVSAWGSPDTKIVNPNGTMIYVYKTQSYAARRTQGSPLVGVNVSRTGHPVIVTASSAPQAHTLTINCLAIFEANAKGKVVRTEVRGRGCYGSAAFARKLERKTS